MELSLFRKAGKWRSGQKNRTRKAEEARQEHAG